MKKAKRKLTLLSSTGILLSSVLFVCAGTVAPVLATLLTVHEERFFFIEDSYGHTYKCFLFEDNNGEPVPGVSIAWGESASNTPEHLIVPKTVSYNEVTYTVRAIAKHAFRYCDFKEITLPNTIEQIEEEAFAYCENLEMFSFPYLIDKIAPSTFIDCRKLANINYLDANGNITFGNNSITEIGDHAFDSCVSLREFYSPKSLVYYGESCFKNCRSLVNYYFPSAKYDGSNNLTNPITVRSYAFADCKSLVYIYFETNVAEIDNYAFVDTNLNLHIKYTGTEIPSYSKEDTPQTHWRDFYLATNLTDPIPVDIEHPVIYPDDTYPCLRYTIENKVVPLDSNQNRGNTINVIDADEIAAEGEYAVIYKFDTPSVDVPGCFTVSSGELTIPETINGKKVKIIGSSAFANNPYIKSINFSENLVQICNRAFLNCLNVESLNFTRCQKLKEVSYYAFFEYDFDNQIYNNKVTSLILPDCLEYIGGYAFSMFYTVNQFKLPENVQAIDDLAFFRLGYSITAGNALVDLKLPKSLNDAAARAANFLHLKKEHKTNEYYEHKNYTRVYAVGKYAFNEAKCLRSVYMEDDPEHENDNSYTTSFYSNVFHTASNLIRFKASKNLQFFGKDAFKKCSNLREVFLTTTKSEASGSDYPWCIDEDTNKYGGTLFFESLPELVCYVDGDSAPGLLSSYSINKEYSSNSAQLNSMWNSETSNSYTNESKTDSNLGRRVVPTYYGIDFDSIKYWNPKTSNFVSAPQTLTDYDAGVIAFAKNSNTNKYAVARYYFSRNKNTGHDLIDLTNIPGISDGTNNDLLELGDECFATSDLYSGNNDNSNRAPGLYFVLPETITKIGERAFYRRTGFKDNATDDPKANGRFGVRIVTYKNSSGNYIAENGSAVSLSDFQGIISSIRSSLDADKRGYCALPGQVTYIGNLAFYNNIFRTVRINSTLSYFGVGAFYGHTVRNEVPKGVIENIYMTANSNFGVESNGVYYIGSANKKMLLSQATGETGVLNIADGTKAVGMMACADTKYSTINLPSGLTTIYGSSFANNRNLTEVTGVSSLRYIGAMENYLGTNTGWSDPDYTEVWDNTIEDYFENYDYRDYAYAPRKVLDSLTCAFYGCNSLTTLDFTSMTELRKIGFQAFYNCSSLKYMAGSNEYVYKQYSLNGEGEAVYTEVTGRESNSANVLDLSHCVNLRSIDKNAFINCSNIKFVHLPDNRNGASQSQLFFGKDREVNNNWGAIFSAGSLSKNYISILVGETAEYSRPGYGTHSSDSHYPNGVFGNNNKVYYYIGCYDDIIPTDSNNQYYWTLGNDGSYILFENATLARHYYPNPNP